LIFLKVIEVNDLICQFADDCNVGWIHKNDVEQCDGESGRQFTLYGIFSSFFNVRGDFDFVGLDNQLFFDFFITFLGHIALVKGVNELGVIQPTKASDLIVVVEQLELGWLTRN